LAKSDRVASAVDYRGSDSDEITNRKSQAASAESDLEPEQRRRITQAHATGKGQFKGKDGEAQLMVKTPGVEPEQKSGRNNPNYGEPIEDDGSSVKQAKFAQTATGAPRKGRSETRPMTVAYRSPSASKETGVKTGDPGSLKSFMKRLGDAEREQSDASIVRFPNGKPVPRKNQYYLQNNPDAAQQHSARQEVAAQSVQQAQTSIADIQAKAAQAKEKIKPQPEVQKPQQQPQRTEPVDTKPQQPTPQPEQKKRKEKKPVETTDGQLSQE